MLYRVAVAPAAEEVTPVLAMDKVGPAQLGRHRPSSEICLTTVPAGIVFAPSDCVCRSDEVQPLAADGLEMLASRQLTTSTTGYRTGSTPASFEPETRARKVLSCEQKGSANGDVGSEPGGAGRAAVGTIVVNAPPTWN